MIMSTLHSINTGVKKKSFFFFFFLKKKPQSHSTVVSPDKQLITKVHEVVHNSFIILWGFSFVFFSLGALVSVSFAF